MTNLLKETLKNMEVYGLVPEDIVYIGTNPNHNPPHYACSWEEFTKLADAEYSSELGSQQVASDLVIVFSDGTFMDRGEYDGSEWWEINLPMLLPEQTKPIKSLFSYSGWEILKEIIEEEN